MIEPHTGDILRADAEALVNTVNCVGIMGRGVALQFKKAFPANFKAYAEACRRKDVQPGRMFVFETGLLNNPRFIINFPTKRHWRGKSRMEDIQSGLAALAKELANRGISSVAVPPLGSGLGGLSWSEVRPRIEAALSPVRDVRVLLFEPDAHLPAGTTANRSSEVPAMSAGRASLVALVDRYLGGLMDPFVTLLEVHKLMYFMQETGQPLRLQYAKGPFGPYAENLRHVLHAIEGHLISGYLDGGDAPGKQLELVPGAVADAEDFLRTDTDTRERLERVADLVAGFETPFGLELLATVHWVFTRDGATNHDDAVRLTHAWNDRKKQFSSRQIGLAVDVLRSKSWLPSVASA